MTVKKGSVLITGTHDSPSICDMALWSFHMTTSELDPRAKAKGERRSRTGRTHMSDMARRGGREGRIAGIDRLGLESGLTSPLTTLFGSAGLTRENFHCLLLTTIA